MSVPTPAERVVETLARETGTDPADLPPLYDAVDPDALNSLFRGVDSSSHRVRFTLADHAVTVSGDGTVAVTTVSREETRSALSPVGVEDE